MKVYISDRGDRSVGINPTEICIDINWVLPKESKQREEMREEFYQAGLALGCEQSWGKKESINVTFEDECPDCLTILVDGKCKNKNCINNWEFGSGLCWSYIPEKSHGQHVKQNYFKKDCPECRKFVGKYKMRGRKFKR